MPNRSPTIFSRPALTVLLLAASGACGAPAAPLDTTTSVPTISSIPVPSSPHGTSTGSLGSTSTTGSTGGTSTGGSGEGTSTGASGATPPIEGLKILAQGAPGLCVDVVSGSLTPGSKVELWGCNTNPNAQAWQVTNGQVRTTQDRCLDVNGTISAGAPLVIMPCAAAYVPTQEWFFVNGSMEVITPAGTFCASPANNQLTAGAAMQLATCGKGLFNQQWSLGYNDGTNTHGISISGGNDCLAAPSDTPKTGDSIGVGTCGMAGTALWTLVSNTNTSELSMNGLCATAASAAAAAELTFATCSTAATQQWEIEQGAIRLVGTDLCVAKANAGVQLAFCNALASSGQLWTWAPF